MDAITQIARILDQRVGDPDIANEIAIRRIEAVVAEAKEA